MKAIIDTSNKTIELLEAVPFSELKEFLRNFVEGEDYTVIPHVEEEYKITPTPLFPDYPCPRPFIPNDSSPLEGQRIFYTSNGFAVQGIKGKTILK